MGLRVHKYYISIVGSIRSRYSIEKKKKKILKFKNLVYYIHCSLASSSLEAVFDRKDPIASRLSQAKAFLSFVLRSRWEKGRETIIRSSLPSSRRACLRKSSPWRFSIMVKSRENPLGVPWQTREKKNGRGKDFFWKLRAWTKITYDGKVNVAKIRAAPSFRVSTRREERQVVRAKYLLSLSLFL